MTRHLPSPASLLLCVFALNAQPPFPPEVSGQSSEVSPLALPKAALVTVEPDEPQYQRTAMWDPLPLATFYTLTVGTFTTNTPATNVVFPLAEGTNYLRLTASYTNGMSGEAGISYFIAVLNITGGEWWCSTNLLTWSRTNEPPKQTNAYRLSGQTYFQYRGTHLVKLDERQVP
jgi:hypothetical protein